MSDATVEEPAVPKKKSKLPVIIGICLALVGGAGGFFIFSRGATGSGESARIGLDVPSVEALPAIAYVPLDPIVISLAETSDVQHLRFRAEIEVNAAYKADVETLRPRIVDVLNTYLRSIEVSELRGSISLLKIRGHMLQRIQIVVGQGRVRDLLIMEFVLT